MKEDRLVNVADIPDPDHPEFRRAVSLHVSG
jgi:hypothetical protein